MSVHVSSRQRVIRRRRLALGGSLGLLALIVVVLISGGGGLPLPPRARPAPVAAPGDVFGYSSSREADFAARATAGEAHVLFTQSPGGALATAARVAAYRGLINRVTAGTGVDPNLLEGLVFVESAGRPQVIAGSDVASAAGLTQILAATGQSLLGMHIDLARSGRLTAQINAVLAGTRSGHLAPLLARRAAADPRFVPAAELAATVRYLRDAQRQFGRSDLAAESYHMGIGNLHQVLGDYDGGVSVPYAQLYFDTAPDRHATAYALLAGFGDDSSNYLWRVLEAERIMHLYRTDRPALNRLAAQQLAGATNAFVLHPQGAGFTDPSTLAAAYQQGAVVPLPSNPAQLGLSYAAALGAGARRVGAPGALYRGLRPVALRVLLDVAARVRRLAGGGTLTVNDAVADAQYVRQTGNGFADSPDGYSFQIDRHYTVPRQATAFQAVLDRLQALNLIAWTRDGSRIDVTVASDAAAWLRSQ
jgi:hypothetical protein